MRQRNFSSFAIMIIALFIFQTNTKAQTPGMIFENPGIIVLDPNGDGFVSKNSQGFSVADKFTNQESEIPYIPFAVVQMEPTYDPGPGPNCFFNDFDDIREYGEPMYSYFDQNTAGGPYLLFRYRLSGYAPNSKSYSVFIDIDGKFGDPAVVGVTAGDPNYTSSNPGFEVEIYLATNFGVGIYNLDGAHSGSSTDPNNIDAKDGTYPYESYAQKAVAWKYTGGTCTDGQEYFYDFYIPWSAVTSLTFSGDTETNIGGSHITTATALRMVGATIMNPNPGFNNGLDNASLSDWGGIDDEGTPEQLVTDLINVFPPTSAEEIDDNNRITPRSDCPRINTPIVGSTAISGTSTEDDGTDITVYVADNSDFTSATTYTTTVSSGEWTVTVPALIENYYVKATAQNTNESYGGITISESVSYDDCDIETVINSCDDNKTPAVYNISEIGGRKGFQGNIVNPLGNTIEVAIYDLDGNLVDLGSSPLKPNPCLTTTTDWIVQADVSGGSFAPGIYYIVSRDLTANICPSDFEYICMSNNNGDYKNIASTPTIDGVSPLSSALTSLTGTTSGENNAIVQVYIDGIISEATVTGTDWELTGLSFSGCEDIEVSQYITQTGSAECVSSKATAIIDSRTASTPSISGSYCEGTNVTISGTSSEVDGSLIEVYENSVLLDTAYVENGEWYLFGQTIFSGNTLTAKTPSGSCLTESSSSAGVIVGGKTTNTGLAVDNTIVENAISVDVTAPSSGGPYTIRLYIDYYNETSWTSPALSVAAGATYTFTGLTDDNGNSLIYAGARLTATAEDAANCESNLSAEYEVPCDISVIETTKTIGGESPVCSGNSSIITIENSQKGIMYQVYDVGNNPIGYTASGNGGDIFISTGSLTYAGVSPALDPQNFTVKATRMVPTTSQCIASLNSGTPVTVNVKEDIGPIDLSVTSTPSPATICSGGTIDVIVSSSQSSIFYQLFNDETNDSLSSKIAGDGNDITITSDAINNTGNIPVRVTASSGTCTADLSTLIGVQLKSSPSISGNLSVCEGASGEIYTTESGMTNYSWSITGGTITSGQNTESIVVTWNTAGKQTISVSYDESICGTTYDVNVTTCGTPGITTTLSGGSNQTSETGTTDAFDVVLNTQPTSDVVIDITGLDATEGALDKTQLTFTNANWDTPQTVTITGQDDALTDGDIILTRNKNVKN